MKFPSLPHSRSLILVITPTTETIGPGAYMGRGSLSQSLSERGPLAATPVIFSLSTDCTLFFSSSVLARSNARVTYRLWGSSYRTSGYA